MKTKELLDSVNTNVIGISELLLFRKQPPKDLHWNPGKKYKFLGEIYDTQNSKYYSAIAGKKYRPKHDEKHLDEGHFQGYRFAIQELTKPGDWILDPTVGSGTAIIEAVNNGRNGIGIELEWPDLCARNVEHQKSKNKGVVVPGNAADLNKLLGKKYKGNIQLVVNGTPYPVFKGKFSSDAPATPHNDGRNYTHGQSFGLLKWNGEYRKFITQMYLDSLSYLKSGGYICTIIKDPIQNKQAFLLQEHIISWIMESGLVEPYGYFIHRHTPETYFMRSYAKMFPAVRMPLYQIGVVLRKV